LKTSDIMADGVMQAMHLADDVLRLTTVSLDQLTAAAGFLVRARACFSDGAAMRHPRRFDAVSRLELAGKAIGAELRKRAFAPEISGDVSEAA
jgi:hypothetical protein